MKHRNSVDMLVDALWDGNDMNKPNTVTSNLIRDLMMRAENAEAEAIKLRASNEQFELQQIELEAKLDAVRGLQRYMPLAKSGHQGLIETEKVCWRRSPDGIEVVRADELDAALEGGE